MTARPGASPAPSRPWQEWLRDALRPNELKDLGDDFDLPASSKIAPLIAGLPPHDMRLPLVLQPLSAAAMRRFELGTSSSQFAPPPDALATRLAAFDRGRFANFVKVSKTDRIWQLAKQVYAKRRDIISSDPTGFTGRELADQLVNHVAKLEESRIRADGDAELDQDLLSLIEALQDHAQRLQKRKRKRGL